MIKFVWFLSVLVMSLLSVSAQAKELEKEINYLLAEIANSSCIFVRNGARHTPDEALKHIKRKYDYLKDDIESAEAFIEKAASKSSFSGRLYLVDCPQKNEEPTRDWLFRKLQVFKSVQ